MFIFAVINSDFFNFTSFVSMLRLKLMIEWKLFASSTVIKEELIVSLLIILGSLRRFIDFIGLFCLLVTMKRFFI